MTMPRPIVRIFISSPGDVNDERDKARRVIDGLQRHYIGVTLQPVLWEDFALPATATFQETIDLILQKEPVDVAVFILWSRLGTPLGPPTVRADGTPYLSGTEREFELMLAAFEQSEKHRPVILAYTRQDESGFRQSLADCPAARLKELIEQRDLAESFIREQFKDAEGHNVRAYHSYREPVSFAQRLHTHLRQVLDELLGADAAPRWLEEPYRGLAVFDVEHAPIFQGRDEETCDILQRLRDQEQAGCAFAVIVGASGSGKSSLARAGVAAALTQHAYDDRVKTWRVVTFFPGLGGSELNRSLTRALAEQLPELRSSATALDDIANGLAKDATLTVKLSIEPAFARAAESAKGAVRILLLVDQMEELWTDRRITSEDRERFLDVLEALARSGHIAVLATLRSDFYPHAQRIPAFLRLKGDRGHCDLLPPGAAALHRLITEPARLAGLQFEREIQTGRTLDQLILQDASRDPAALPLLQYALSELYQQRDATHRTLTFAAYQTLGGVEGALGKRAAETFQSLPPEVRAALPEILPLLVTIDIAGEQSAVRRRAPLAELTATPARRALTENLIAARFLTTDRQDDTPIVSLAHEALLRRWNELAEWVTSNREHLRLRARAEQNQQRWSQQEEDPSLFLPSGLPLEEGQILVRDARPLLNAETANYIERSLHHRQAESRRQRLIRTTALAMSLTAALVAIVAAIWINSERSTAVVAKNKETQAKNEERRQRGLAQDSERAAISAKEAEAKQRDLAEKQQTEANRQNANHYWHQAANLRNSNESEPIRVSHLFLRGAQSLAQIPSSQITIADNSLLRSATHAAFVVDRVCVRGWALDTSVSGAEFSRDESRVLTWGGDPHLKIGAARLWDVTKPELIRTFEHDNFVTGAMFSRDESRLLTWGDDNTARLWDMNKPEPIQTFKHADQVKGAQFSRDELRVLTWSRDTTARLWEVSRPEPLQTFKHDRAVNGALFSRDESRLLTWSFDNTARLWDVTKPELIRTFEHDNSVRGVRFSRDESRVLTWGDDNTARLWDVNQPEPLQTFKHDSLVGGAQFSQNESRVLTWSYDKTSRLWDVTNPEPIQTFKHEDIVRGAQFSRDELRVLTWSQGTTARLWDVSRPEPLQTFEHDRAVNSALFSRDESRVLTCSDDHTARLWDVTKAEPLQTFKHDSAVHGAVFSRDELHVLTKSTDYTSATTAGVARLWNVSQPELLRTFNHEGKLVGAQISRDKSHVLTWSNDKNARLWDVNKSEPLQTFKHDGLVWGAQFSRDESRVLTWSEDKTSRLWDVAKPEPLQTFKHDGPVVGAQFSRDELRVLTWSNDGTVRLWDVTKSEPIQIFRQKGPITGAVFSSDESRVLTWGETARLWDVTKSEPLRTFEHDDWIYGARFSGDESRILTWSGVLHKRGEARLWDISKPESIRVFKHDSYVMGATFSKDELRILTWSDDTASLWELSSPDLFRSFKHGSYVRGARLSRDSARVLTWSGGERIVRLWNVNQRDQFQAYEHDNIVEGAMFSHDESRLLTWGGDNTTRLWDATKSDPLQIFKHHDFVNGAQFSRDELCVLTWSYNGTVRLWDLTDHLAVLSPDERILELEVRSGTTLDANLKLRTLSFEEWQAKAKSPEYRVIEKKLAERPQAQVFANPAAARENLPSE